MLSDGGGGGWRWCVAVVGGGVFSRATGHLHSSLDWTGLGLAGLGWAWLGLAGLDVVAGRLPGGRAER